MIGKEMVEFTSVDSTLVDYGDKAFLVGVVLEVDNGTEFDEHYLETLTEFADDYDIDLAFPVVKSEYLLKRVPGYKIREGTERLAKELLLNPALRRVHITIGWFDRDTVEVGDRGETMSGIRFLNNNLQQYFPIVALYDYLQEHQRYGNIPDEAWVDSVQGQITQAWYDMGKQFDMNIVPHGDITYPSIATADYLAAHLKRTLPKSKSLSEMERAAKGWAIGKYDEADKPEEETPFIESNSVNEDDADIIVPEFSHRIKSEQHYPHPTMFIHDKTFDHIENNVLPKTDFHSYARQWAQEHSGCVVNFRADRLPDIVESGDRIVFTSEEIPHVCRQLQRLNPSKNIELMTSDGIIEQYYEE
jgi:hypothetical protein